MELLPIVQALHYEARLPGSPPSAVTAQVGRAADLVRWTIEAYNDIQRDKDGKWKWLRGEFTLDTVADQAAYSYADAEDVDTSAAITRFRRWELDEEDPPFIYLVSDGIATETELTLYPWFEFRRLYVRAEHEAAIPGILAVDPRERLYLGPTPDDIYRVSGNYWKSNQTLEEDDDEPEMPADYHMLIVYRALMKYAYDIVSQDVLARATTEGGALYTALVSDQWYGRMRLRWPEPLA